MNRISRLILVVLALTPSFSGCASSRKPKPTSAIAGELEEGFKEKWVTKRVGELLLSGQAGDGLQARKMALQEFSDRYGYVRGTDRR